MDIQKEINKENYIYKITLDIDLKGNTITIPKNCTLDFQGGSFSNGEILFLNTLIKTSNDNIFRNIKTIGNLKNTLINLDWFSFNKEDSASYIRNIFILNSDSNACLIDSEKKIYEIDNLLLENKSSFSIDCKSIFKRKDNLEAPKDGIATSSIILKNCSDVYINNINIDVNAINNNCKEESEVYNTEYKQEWRHSLHIQGGSNIHIKNIYINQPSGDGICITNGATFVKIDNVLGTSYKKDGSILAVGRNLVSIINAKDVIIDSIWSKGIGHWTMPGGLDIEPNMEDTVKNVKVNYIYSESFSNAGLGINTKYGGGNNIENIHINNAVIYSYKNRATRNLVIAGATNVTIDNLYIKAQPKALAIHIGITGDKQPVFNLNINNAYVENSNFGAVIDNLFYSNIHLRVKDICENFIRLYKIENSKFYITGSFTEDENNIHKDAICVRILDSKEVAEIKNCCIEGNLNRDVVGKLAKRAVSTSTIDLDLIKGVDISNLDLNNWDDTLYTLANASKLFKRNFNLQNKTNVGNTSQRPVLNRVDLGYIYYDTSLLEYIFWDGTQWKLYNSSSIDKIEETIQQLLSLIDELKKPNE